MEDPPSQRPLLKSDGVYATSSRQDKTDPPTVTTERGLRTTGKGADTMAGNKNGRPPTLAGRAEQYPVAGSHSGTCHALENNTSKTAPIIITGPTNMYSSYDRQQEKRPQQLNQLQGQ